jgi:hypothetical protein
MLQTLRDTGTANEPNMPNKDISPSSTVVCSDENLSCDLQGEAVLLNLQSGIYFGLNPLGARIWELIKKPAKVSDVHQQLLNEYEVDASQCEADLVSFLKLLQAHSLIRVHDAGNNSFGA